MLTRQDIKARCMSEEVFKRGERLYKEHKIRSFQIDEVDEKEGAYFYSVVEGSYQNSYRVTILIQENRVGGTCQCPASYEYRGLCKHMVATLLRFLDEKDFIKDYLQKKKEQRVYQYGESLLAQYEQSVLKEVETEKIDELVDLYPKLHLNYMGRFSISLTVGNRRPYVVKDVYAFANAVLQEESFSYGKNLSFIHSLDNFSDQSRPLASFVVDKAIEYEEMAGPVQGAINKKNLPLTPISFETFFDFFQGQWIEYEGEYDKIFLQKSNPPLSFTLAKEGGKFALRLFVAGENHLDSLIALPYGKSHYVFIWNHLYLCEEGFAKSVFPLIESFERIAKEQEEVKLLFDEKGVRRLMVSVLPTLKKHVSVEIEEGLLEKYAPIPLKIALYLDRDESGNVIGYTHFAYGEIVFNPYEKLPDSVTTLARDVSKEHIFHKLLAKYGFRTQKGKLHITDEEEIYTLLTEGIEAFLEIGEVHVTEGLKQMQFTKAPIGSIGVKLKSGLLELNFEGITLPIEEITALLNAYTIKKKYYRLKSGSFVDLRETGMMDMAQLMSGLDLNGKELKKGKVELARYRALYLDSLLKSQTTIAMDRDQHFKKLIRDMKNIEDADYEIPDSLKGILRSYQKTGYRWLSAMENYGFGGILADDMGLGKTLQVITLFLSQQTRGKSEPSIVVAPTSLVLNWQKEIEKFAPALSALPIVGTVEERKEKILNREGYNVLITSYDLLKRDIDIYKECSFHCCIADEAHYIKNPQTQNAKALKLIRSQVRFALTGTPMENALSELWSLFDFIMPGYLMTYPKFKQKLEMPITKEEDEEATKRLQRMIQPFILRRLKKDVLKELPDKTQTVLYNRMEQTQRKLYEANTLSFKKEIARELKDRGIGKSGIKILSLLTRLRQLCAHPRLYLEDYEGESSKLVQCLELIEESVNGGHKILLFSQFTSMLELIRQELMQRGISYYMLTGKTKAEERMAKVEAFNQDETQIFLISLKAGGTGLNLTGADIVIHYDPWWNLSSQNQATDRAYRIGQKNNVQVFDLITEGTIEEKIKKLQERKTQLSEAVLTEGQSMIHQMSEQELMELFSLE